MVSWFSTIRVCSLLAVLAATSACRKSLLIYGAVPDFHLTSQSGAEFHASSLDGSVWVADFFFTHCTGPCPRMNARLRQIEKTAFPGRADLKLVSFTVDPARDSAPVLDAYAHQFGAEPGRWFFLTGPLEQLNNLARNVFLLGTVTGDLDHSTRFVLVDRKRQIRGFYPSNEPEKMQQLLVDIRTLLKEKP